MDYNIEDLEGEEWRDVLGYEGVYYISNMGRVKAVDRNRKGGVLSPRTLHMVKPKTTTNGYFHVVLCLDGKQIKHSISRMVAMAFIDNPENKLCVDHIDRARKNNKSENLRWVTHSENLMNDRTVAYRRLHSITSIIHNQNGQTANLKRRGANSANSKPIFQYSLKGDFIKEWDCAYDIGRELNISPTNIGKVCRGERPWSYGFIWKFKNNVENEKSRTPTPISNSN